MFIIEGSDNLGKSTLAQSVLQEAVCRAPDLPWRLAHMGRPDAVFDFHKDYRPLMDRLAVQDRFHLGSLVWHDGVMTDEHLTDITEWLHEIGAFTVILYTSQPEWYHNRLQRSQRKELFDVDRLLAANEQYRQMFNLADDTYDVRNGRFPAYEDICAWVDKWFERLGVSV